MTVIVTGGSGRLGRSVLERWVSTGQHVVNIDRHPSGVPGVEELDVDLLDTTATADAFSRIGADIVVHLAAISVPFAAPEDLILAVNIGMAYTVIDAAAASGATRILVASSPTVLGYGSPSGWLPASLPLDESHPVAPWNAYAASKVSVEVLVGMAARRHGDAVRFAAFRPCYVIAPEEWRGAPTQQGHTVRERLERPELAAISLFNYVDARDAADFTVSWVDGCRSTRNGNVYLVGAGDALALEPLASLIPRFSPELAPLAVALRGSDPAFSSAKARNELGWRATRTWRDELSDPHPVPMPVSRIGRIPHSKGANR